MPSLESYDSFVLGSVNAICIGADPKTQKKILNTKGGKIFYKTASNVSTSDTEVAVGSSVTVEATVWIISESSSRVFVETLEGPTRQDFTVSDDLTVGDTLTVTGASALTGALTTTGGVVSSGTLPGVYAGNWSPLTNESGTDTAFAEKKLFVTSLFLPTNKKIKGIGYLLGAGGGTNKVVAGLFSSAGKLLAKTTETSEGTTAGTEKTIQEIDLTAEYSATGPGVYFIGVTANGATAKLRTIPANTAGKNILAGEVELSEKNKLADITAPSGFTGGKGVVGFVY